MDDTFVHAPHSSLSRLAGRLSALRGGEVDAASAREAAYHSPRRAPSPCAATTQQHGFSDQRRLGFGPETSAPARGRIDRARSRASRLGTARITGQWAALKEPAAGCVGTVECTGSDPPRIAVAARLADCHALALDRCGSGRHRPLHNGMSGRSDFDATDTRDGAAIKPIRLPWQRGAVRLRSRLPSRRPAGRCRVLCRAVPHWRRVGVASARRSVGDRCGRRRTLHRR